MQKYKYTEAIEMDLDIPSAVDQGDAFTAAICFLLVRSATADGVGPFDTVTIFSQSLDPGCVLPIP